MKFLIAVLILVSNGTITHSQINNNVIQDTIGKGLLPYSIVKGNASLKFFLPDEIKMEVTDSVTYVSGLKKNMKLYVNVFIEGRDKDEYTLSGSACSLSHIGNKTFSIQFGEKLSDFTLIISVKKRNGSSSAAGIFRFRLRAE
ncbi:MAG: hypothetical protein HYZ14_04060 [Bacteroidetes bacterium]|nr:hypothetical protein [Bacteroidota bacterium]